MIKWKDREKTRAMWLPLIIIMLARMKLMKITWNHTAFFKLNKLPVWLSKSSLFPFHRWGDWDTKVIRLSQDHRQFWELSEGLLTPMGVPSAFWHLLPVVSDWLGVSLHDLWTRFPETTQHVLFSPVVKMKLVNDRITNYEQWWFRRPDFRLFSDLVNSHYGILPGYSSWKDNNYSLFKGFN